MARIPSSGSVSSFSTTGETIYEDAVQNDTSPESIEAELTPIDTPTAPVTEEVPVVQEETAVAAADADDAGDAGDSGTAEDVDAKTAQPTETPPPTYAKQRGYQPEESQCKSFWCTNWLSVMDLPDGEAGCCMCCNMCCNACFSTGVSQAKTI